MRSKGLQGPRCAVHHLPTTPAASVWALAACSIGRAHATMQRQLLLSQHTSEQGPCKLVKQRCMAGMAGGLRASGPKADIALVVAEAGAAAAGVFTTNLMCAAPVTYCREVLAKSARAKAVRHGVLMHGRLRGGR